jgi:hypothetical protein
MSEAISASLDHYREMRDAISEAAFFQTYGNVFSLYFGDARDDGKAGTAAPPMRPNCRSSRMRSTQSAKGALPRRSRARPRC